MNPFAGVALKIASTLVFTGMATVIKLVADRFPLGEIAFARSFFALIPVFAWVAWRGQLGTVFHTRDFRGHALRSIMGIGSLFFGFAALTLLPIADATAIGYAAPLMTVGLAALLLGEAVHRYRWAAVTVGLVGVLIILFDYATPAAEEPPRSIVGAALSLTGAVFVAFTSIQIRRLTRTEPAATIVVYFSCFASIAGLLTLPFGWVVPSPGDAALLVLMGLFGGVGQVCMTQSFRFADASLLAPFDYASIIWALIVSIFLFNDLPTPLMLFGTAIVVGSGLFVIWRERQLGIQRARSRQVQPPPLS